MQLQKGKQGKSVVFIMFKSFIKHRITYEVHIVVVQLTSFCNHLCRYDKKKNFFSPICVLFYFFLLNQSSIK